MPNPNLRPLTQKVLESGLVDRQTVKMLEAWKYLPSGSSDEVKEDALKNATREQVIALAEELGEELEKQSLIRETSLDLRDMKWPVTVSIYKTGDEWPSRALLVQSVSAMMDRMGRYYFQINSVKEEWLVPGYQFERMEKGGHVLETLTERQQLFTGDQPICWQVSTRKEKTDE